MEAFDPTPPTWTQSATHAFNFCCPSCRSTPMEAVNVWMNRRSPVYTQEHRRKWQEFYRCQCSAVWWAWSDERPPSEWVQERSLPEED